MLEERRQHARWVPPSPMFVSLDASKSGLLLDVGAGGIAVASLIPRNLEEVIAMEFELPEGCGRISANAAIAWTRDDGHLSGARFLDLDEASRAQLSQWIGTIANLTGTESALAEPTLAVSQGAESEAVKPEAAEPEDLEPQVLAPEVLELEEQASLFHPEPIEKSSKSPAEIHPVDAYFLEPPKKEVLLKEIPVIGDEAEAPVSGEQEAVKGTETEEPDYEGRAWAKSAEFDRLISEAETAEVTEEQSEATHCSPRESAAEISHEPVETTAETQESMPTETIAAETAAIQTAALEAPAEQEEETVFVTRSTYTQTEQAAQDEHEAQMHLERAAVFGDAAKTEVVACEQPTDWVMRPWNIPRTAGLQILTEPGPAAESGKSRHTIELILAVVVLSWALVFLGYQMGSTGVSRESSKGKESTTAGGGVASDSSKGLVPSVEASSALAETRPPSTGGAGTKPEAATRLVAKGELESVSTLGDPGTVLQVGAMKLEDNADALARELQKKNLPAFVFRHGRDRLYRVAVGPFSNEQATGRAKTSLEKQGLKPILRRWLPE
jgi:cell division septation protein DedD